MKLREMGINYIQDEKKIDCEHEITILVRSKNKNDEEHIMKMVEDGLFHTLADDYNVQEEYGGTDSLDTIEYRLLNLYREAKRIRRKDFGYRFSEIPIFLIDKLRGR